MPVITWFIPWGSLCIRTIKIIPANNLCIRPIKTRVVGVTVLEAIQKSADFLAKRGVDPARLNAELLPSHTLQWPRMKLYLKCDRVLTEGETAGLRELVKRRGQREPLQHITGSTSF